MTDERRTDTGRLAGLSRRQILASVGAIGVAGAFTGAGTHALLNEGQRVSGTLETGGVGIGVELDCEENYCSVSPDGELSFGFDGIEPGDSGSVSISLRAEENPARLWLATDCPPSYDPLGEALRVWIQPRNWNGVSQIPERGTWTLSQLKRELHDGLRIGEGCLDPSDRRAIELVLRWFFPYEDTESLAGETSDLTFELHADQCRHVPEEGAVNPFADRAPCPDVCEPCTSRLSESTMEYVGPTTADVAVYVPSGNVEAVEQLYPTDGSESVELPPGGMFTVPLPMSGQPEAAFYVDGKKNAQLHTSCSDPIAPGIRVGDFRLVGARNADGVPLCHDLECVDCTDGSNVGGLLVRYTGEDNGAEARDVRAYYRKQGGQGPESGLQGLLFDGQLSQGDEFFLEASSREGSSTSGSAFESTLYLVVDGGERELEVRCDPGPLTVVGSDDPEDTDDDAGHDFEVLAAHDPFGFPFCGGGA
ncbi:hypothetical protein AArcSl_2077 [Halalkaliarchaeum desulfuricum]|uniref:Uncharacterized protein n=1 Tax=Halalkaliarchaeum desulfuricum TaxID=2055893 RepID=A0A343TKT0_9EURY|nr:hypothetical protein [Halalkaliarchaeum desulfuricum]AUX09702.1 hypothetical protein AArcSl_2077 [Halalkaliarchaeum desulfuricum]